MSLFTCEYVVDAIDVIWLSLIVITCEDVIDAGGDLGKGVKVAAVAHCFYNRWWRDLFDWKGGWKILMGEWKSMKILFWSLERLI